jgi:L-threonylcarbamoyladenylate synthase
VAAIPTETFYGLAADPMSPSGVGRIFDLKGREESQALLVLVAAREQLAALGVEAPSEVLDRFLALWPAPLTVVLPLRAPIAASAGRRTLGVRVPAHAPLRQLLARVGPLTGTSLNRSGEPPASDPDDVERAFGQQIDVLVDGGRTAGLLASTLLDATVDPPRVLRDGAYPWPPEGR